MSEAVIVPPSNPLQQNALAGGAIAVGSPIACQGVSGTVVAQVANSSRPATSPTLGLAATPGVTGGIVTYQFAGTLVQPAAAWEAIIDGGGAPTLGVAYYVSPTTAGNITTVEPTGMNEVVPVGVFLTTTIFQIGPMPSVPASEG